jgi:hypothetical protein
MLSVDALHLTKAASTRDLARRARRLAGGLTRIADRARLESYADELDQRAAVLERETTYRGQVIWKARAGNKR